MSLKLGIEIYHSKKALMQKPVNKVKKIESLVEQLSPLMVRLAKGSVTVSFSRRFLLFRLMKFITNRIEEDPYLNFISALKHYKVLGKFLHGTISEFYRDRDKSYFKNFFLDRTLYEQVKQDLEWAYERHRDLNLTITKRGVIIYDNYKKNSFNVLLLTVHSGLWLPKDIEQKQAISRSERYKQEDVDTHKIYSPLVLENAGIWIDSKLSRFACDFNRTKERCIYSDKSEPWFDSLWKEPLSVHQKKRLWQNYDEFYFTLGKLIDSYRFNIIFDGHSMVDEPGRPEISFGTEYIPRFYMSVVRSMRDKLQAIGYKQVSFNTPYRGGNILAWFNQSFPDVFICSMEINKKLYMSHDHEKSNDAKIKNLSKNILSIFAIE